MFSNFKPKDAQESKVESEKHPIIKTSLLQSVIYYDAHSKKKKKIFQVVIEGHTMTDKEKKQTNKKRGHEISSK